MDVGTVQSPAVNVTMPGQRRGRRFRSRIKPLAPMGTCIGANGWLRGSSTSRGVLALQLKLDIISVAYSGFVMLRRSMFIPPKFSLTT